MLSRAKNTTVTYLFGEFIYVSVFIAIIIHMKLVKMFLKVNYGCSLDNRYGAFADNELIVNCSMLYIEINSTYAA